ncbi:hypothetical protein BCCGELA001_31270 [Bradyrhizobium sp. CCGE-LA001]|nr:hypothetical protein BCCGELA001_31270 [Bradyrhizobium sp. CCGE-LA001]
MIERLLPRTPRSRIHRGVFENVATLKMAIIEMPKPSIQTKSADQILEKLARTDQLLVSQH